MPARRAAQSREARSSWAGRFVCYSLIVIRYSRSAYRLRVLVADVFDQLGVGFEMLRLHVTNRLGIGLGIIDGDGDIHVAQVAPAEALRQFHGFRVWMTETVQPGLVVEADGFDDEFISVPPAN